MLLGDFFLYKYASFFRNIMIGVLIKNEGDWVLLDEKIELGFKRGCGSKYSGFWFG